MDYHPPINNIFAQFKEMSREILKMGTGMHLAIAYATPVAMDNL